MKTYVLEIRYYLQQACESRNTSGLFTPPMFYTLAFRYREAYVRMIYWCPVIQEDSTVFCHLKQVGAVIGQQSEFCLGVCL